jgi:hypothetical protein
MYLEDSRRLARSRWHTPRHGHHLLLAAESYAANMTGDRRDVCWQLGPKPGRWWKIAGLAFTVLLLGDVALDFLAWVRLGSGGGLLALVEGLFFACSSLVVLRLTVTAFTHSSHGDPQPEAWYEAVFGKRNQGQTP